MSREARLSLALEAAPGFLINRAGAREIIDAMVEAVRTGRPEVADEAGMTRIERAYFAGRQVLNPHAFDDYGTVPDLR